MSSPTTLSPHQLQMMKDVDRAIDNALPIIGVITERFCPYTYIRTIGGMLYHYEMDRLGKSPDVSEAVFHDGKTYTDFCIQIIMAAKEGKTEEKGSTDSRIATGLIRWILLDSEAASRDETFAQLCEYRVFGEDQINECNEYFDQGAIVVWIDLALDVILPVFPMSKLHYQSDGNFLVLRTPHHAYFANKYHLC